MTEPVLQASDIPEYHRTHHGAFAQWVGRSILRLAGWTVVGHMVTDRKVIITVAPHTSNWDFVFGMSALLALDLRCNWMGKDTLFRQPFAGLMRWLGGIPVYRDRPEGIAEQMAELMRNSDAMALIITPEGTRGYVDSWKTGFLRIAKAADCDVLMGSLDFENKRMTLGDVYKVTDDIDKDIANIKNYYSKFPGKHPERH